ncbi:MAG: NAD-dependent epimerase/dehydratase family protein [Longimicrobiales bacterium]
MKIVLTGSRGFLGSHILSALSSDGNDIRCIGRVHDGEGGVKIDLTDHAAVQVELDGADILVHAAGKTTDVTQLGDNVAMAAAMADAAGRLGVPTINLSSLAVYGRAPAGSVDESAACSPVTLYGESKLEAERSFDAVDGGTTCHLRVGNVFTAAMFAAATGGLVRRVLKGNEISNLVFAQDIASIVTFLVHIDPALWPRYANAVRPDVGLSNWREVARLAGTRVGLVAAPVHLPHVLRILAGSRSRPANTKYHPAALSALGYRFASLSEVAPASWRVGSGSTPGMRTLNRPGIAGDSIA